MSSRAELLKAQSRSPRSSEWRCSVAQSGRGEGQVAVLPLDLELVRRTLGARRPPTLLQHLLSGANVESAAPNDSGLLGSYLDRLEAVTELWNEALCWRNLSKDVRPSCSDLIPAPPLRTTRRCSILVWTR